MSVHEDTLLGLQEALDYAKGNITLKSTVIEITDEDISEKFNQLPGDIKQAIRIIIDNTLKMNRGAVNPK
jgi:hypothetical protein